MRRFILSLALLVCTGTACTSHQPPERPAQLPALPQLTPVSDVWPEAVITVPGKLKNGTAVLPVAMLSANAVLLTTRERRPTFLSLDLRTDHPRVLATAPKWAACGGCFEIQRTAVSATQVALLIKGYKSDSQYEGQRQVELWAMPRSGGPMRKVTGLPANGQDHLRGFEITNDLAVWWNSDGIWRVPLTGGEPERVLPERDLLVTSWPWAYDEKRQSVINMVNRHESQVRPGDNIDDLRCGSMWCVGRVIPQPYGVMTAVVQRTDGSGRTTIPGTPLDLAPIRDRLALFGLPGVFGDDSVAVTWGSSRLGPSIQLYDRCTRQAALLGSPDKTKAQATWNEIEFGAATPNGPTLFWKTTRGRYTVLDLSRVTDPPCA
ncbi:hypothetical protein [Streptosporangium sp. V21-05]|uniref:hypothetical protein n=1 Tax=Streptosporangium sp. V21-05 TaxID=3446115 RepID=UPI003F5357E9